MPIKNHPLYKRWCFIKEITTNPNSDNYKLYAGAHGIENHFESFAEFAGYVEKRLGLPPFPGAKLHRIDPKDHFRPGNLAWADQKTVSRKQRPVIYVKYKNQTKSISQWAEEYGIVYATMIERYHSGWTPAQMMGIKPGPRQEYIMKLKKKRARV